MLWIVDAAVSPGVTTDDAEGTFENAEGDAVFEDGLAAVFGAGGEEGAEAGGVKVFHRTVIERKGFLICNDGHRGNFSDGECCGHRSLAR